ncbi:kinase-like domain, phloem protein 2-like protein [Tanacetum coccineum]
MHHIAIGMEFLHGTVSSPEMVIHRDMRSSNILLFDDWKAKITDFGLSLVCPMNQDVVIDNVTGTMGYQDPLCSKTGFLTKESDIFSLGAVLFDILCGKISSEKVDDEYLYLPFLAKQHYHLGKLDELLKKALEFQGRGVFSGVCNLLGGWVMNVRWLVAASYWDCRVTRGPSLRVEVRICWGGWARGVGVIVWAVSDRDVELVFMEDLLFGLGVGSDLVLVRARPCDVIRRRSFPVSWSCGLSAVDYIILDIVWTVVTLRDSGGGYGCAYGSALGYLCNAGGWLALLWGTGRLERCVAVCGMGHLIYASAEVGDFRRMRSVARGFREVSLFVGGGSVWGCG